MKSAIRILIFIGVGLLILVSCNVIPFLAPVRPYIQLPGEAYPGSSLPIIGAWTNTFTAALIAWALVLILAFSLKAGSRTVDEVPTGWYNFLEMIIEGAYNFAKNIAGPQKIKDFFPFFMTYLLVILAANWMGLIPGVDSIGLWEHKPHFLASKEVKDIKAEVEAREGEDLAAYLARLESTYELEHSLEVKDGKLTDASYDELLHAIEVEIDAENGSDFRSGLWLLRADRVAEEGAPIGETEEGYKTGRNPEAADWTIVPFLRPAATDLNMTLAFAIIAMVMVQFFGFKYLGARGYLAKFFPFIAPGFVKEASSNPIRLIDPAVGILELISEFSKVISFAFRLLGNIFAGMVLLFVMAFLMPAANIVFYGLEFFVGLIQAVVFALLMLVFMVSATESHHGDDHH